MKTLVERVLLIVAVLLAVSGCKELDPVHLDPGGGQGPIEIVSPPPAPMPGTEMGDADSAGIMMLPPERAFGQVVVAGARYDGPIVSTRVSASRAIFFDRSSPVELVPGRIAYRTLDAGVMTLNALPMLEIEKRARTPDGDTLLGAQYVLYNRLPAGFTYTGGAAYTWAGTGAGAISPFTLSIVAPEELAVQNLSPQAAYARTEPLQVRWSGGGHAVHLIISVPGDQPAEARPVLHLRLGPNGHGIILPPRVLALLPRDREFFVFTFVSGEGSTAAVPGYADPVLVQAVTSHSILLHLTR